MDKSELIGKRVMNRNTKAVGGIISVEDRTVTVDFHGACREYSYPAAFAEILELEDDELQKQVLNEGTTILFDNFIRQSCSAVRAEIEFLKASGGKKYRIMDGELLPSRNGDYQYAFDTDTDYHFPDGTAVKLWFPDSIVNGYVVSCEDFTIIIRSMEYLGKSVESVEFTAEQWQLLETLTERLNEMSPDVDSLAYQVACCGQRQISARDSILCGQNAAFRRATSESITFIWGPPGTGKTETLANIALEHIQIGKRVLMLSYSNVSVDGALLRVAKKADLPIGTVVRYGYPRSRELLESHTLTSYQVVLSRNPDKAREYGELTERKKKLKRKDPERIRISKQLNQLRELFLEQEKNSYKMRLLWQLRLQKPRSIRRFIHRGLMS